MHCNGFRKNPEKLSRIVENKMRNGEEKVEDSTTERGAKKGESNKGNADLDLVFLP